MLNQGYDSDGEPGPFCDAEDLEDTQIFYKDYLPDVVPLDDGENYSSDEGEKSVAEGGDRQNKSIPSSAF